MKTYISEALVDYSGIGKTVNDLLGRFSVLQFLDFCTFIEGVVLYDRLIMVGGGAMRADGTEGDVITRWNENIQLLFDESVVVREEQRSSPINVGVRPERKRRFENVEYQMGYTIEDAWYETGRLIGAEKIYKKPSLPLLRQKPYYEKSAHVVADHVLCDLFSRYKELDEVLLQIRKSTDLPGVNYISVPIPSLPLMVLQRSNKVTDLIRVTLEVREEFERLRHSLTSMRTTLADPTVKPEEKRRALHSWVNSWQTLLKYQEQASYFQLATASNNMLDFAKSLDGIGLDSFKWSKIIQKMIETFESTFYAWKIRQLHKSAENYLSISNSDLAKEIKRLFGPESVKIHQ